METKLVLLTNEDIPTVARIEKETFSEAWSENAFAEAVGSTWHRFYCLKIRGIKQDGAASGDMPESEWILAGYIGYAVSPPEAEITNVAVDIKFRGQGYGNVLMKEALGLMKQEGIETVFLEVRAGNVPAIGLYTKYEFEKIGVRKKFYRFPDEDAIVMMRALNNKE